MNPQGGGWDTGEPIITVHRLPSWFAIAMTVAPLVRQELISDAEARMLIGLRYAIRRAELAA